MTYSESSKRASSKYIKEKQKSILIKFRKDDFTNRIEPAIKESGLPIVTYIKKAINEKIDRDGSNHSKPEDLQP